MKSDTISPSELRHNSWNTNRMDAENFNKLKKSLKSLGAFKPIIVRETKHGLEVLGGAHRLDAARELGFPTVPIFNLGNIDDDRAKEISLVDNTRYGQDDAVALSKLLDSFETDLLEEILPETTVELPDTDDILAKLDEDMKAIKDEEETHKVLKFRLSVEDAEEVEAVLSKIAAKFEYRYPDGYSNYSEALHHLALRFTL